jgi:hypothetical protein
MNCAALLLPPRHCSDAKMGLRFWEEVMPYLGNREPPLHEVLDDPIVRLVMERDRLTREEVRAQIAAAQRQSREERRWTDGFI